MNNYLKGRSFEDYISYVYQLILDSESKQGDEPIILARNTHLSKNNYSAEFDIYYEFTKAGIRHRVAIECKNHVNPVGISDIRDFHSKLSDFHVVGVCVSNSGFQEGAKSYAKDKDILLLTTQEVPGLMEVISKRLEQLFLPPEYIKGEPFYILMEITDGRLTGNYHWMEMNHVKYIPLFLSRKMAYQYLLHSKEEGLTPRAFGQETYDYIIRFARQIHADFHLILNIADNNMVTYPISPSTLKSNFFDL